jgi:hypothetical protein
VVSFRVRRERIDGRPEGERRRAIVVVEEARNVSDVDAAGVRIEEAETRDPPALHGVSGWFSGGGEGDPTDRLRSNFLPHSDPT